MRETHNQMRLIVGISGASGVHLGLKFITLLPREIELFVIISNGAVSVAQSEAKMDLESALLDLQKQRDFRIFKEQDLDAPLSSGSFGIDSMAIIPTSLNTLAKIANGLSDDLISRAGAVMLKEGKKLLLAVREMPLSAIALRQMASLSALGVVIAPPVAGYYAARDLEQMEQFFIGKWFDSLGIKNTLYQRWE